MGDLIRKRFENTLEPHLTKKWRLQRSSDFVDPQRLDMSRKVLDIQQLVTAVEMQGEVEAGQTKA